jgi:hypothetical protein
MGMFQICAPTSQDQNSTWRRQCLRRSLLPRIRISGELLWTVLLPKRWDSPKSHSAQSSSLRCLACHQRVRRDLHLVSLHKAAQVEFLVWAKLPLECLQQDHHNSSSPWR